MSQIVVLKIGGSLGNQTMDVLAHAVRLVLDQQDLPLVVHGGGPRISQALQRANLELPFVQGQRLTTAEAVPIVQRVLEQEISGEIVCELRKRGVLATRLFGSGGLLQAQPLPNMERTAGIAHVHLSALWPFLSSLQAVVITPMAVDDLGQVYNVNADTAAAAIAAATSAAKFVLLTDVPGIYADYSRGDMLTDTDSGELQDMLRQGRFEHGMIPKVQAVLSALGSGIPECFVVHGGDSDAVTWALTGEAQLTFKRGTRIRWQSDLHQFEGAGAKKSHA